MTRKIISKADKDILPHVIQVLYY